jgi:hypothetical protein
VARVAVSATRFFGALCSSGVLHASSVKRKKKGNESMWGFLVRNSTGRSLVWWCVAILILRLTED